MIKTLVIWALLCLTVSFAVCSNQQLGESYSPTTLNFNKQWQFYRVDSVADKGAENFDISSIEGAAWEQVELPHTTRIEPKVTHDQWQGFAWYRKSFTAEPQWRGKKAFLRFEGAMNKAEVWVNNKKMITHHGGYLPFVIDLSSVLSFDQPNEIVVKLDNRDSLVTGPKPLTRLDFNMYGGLYRNVFLLIKNQLHISDEMFADKVASGGVYASFPRVSSKEAEIAIKTHIKNDSKENQQFKLRQTLYFKETKVLEQTSKALSLAAGHDIEVQQSMLVATPKLWSTNEPNLYQLVTEVVSEAKVVDKKQTRLGIRRFEIAKDGFKLNGKEMFLRGVNRHQEYPYIGYALSDNAQYRDAVKIKAAGFDFVRLSHYPQSPAFMDAADELGLLVLNDILGWQYYSDSQAFRQHVIKTCRDMIRRDRNHPSVLAWECSLNESRMTEKFIDKLNAAVHEECPSDQCFSAGWKEYGYDIYVQARQHRLKHAKHKKGKKKNKKTKQQSNKPYIVSEYGDWEYHAMNAGLNQDNWAGLMAADRSSRQLLSDGEKRLLQQATNIQESHNDNFNTRAFADGYWVMFDYNRGFSADLESSGIMSIDRLPKYGYYFFQSQRDASEVSEKYDSGPMIFIASEWQQGSDLNVRIFSNCEQVELFLNGKSLGIQKPDKNANSNNLAHPPFTFNLDKFEQGELKALGYIDGKVTAHHHIATPQAPFKIELEIDESGKQIQAGVNDTVFVYAKIVDQKGNVIPLSGEEISFTVEGDISVVNSNSVKTEAGIASVLIRVGDSLTGAVIKAQSQMLSQQSIKISSN
ncbi:glycoside hydrolase family 2 TIM barrel-domain containing protein [Colwellia piezophila]|uniref:glycoside hydrolase family 2 TIM barrel-domain containing protein n=1 Tax=Colwellia piezophila TaxID=211668 RepID=UPI000361C8B5|nr:glycoside hydrolase family 2 TIM barrel-domain containing protein [Colwellia piezophila]